MSTRFGSSLPAILLGLPLICFAVTSSAAPKTEGRITAVVNDVTLHSPPAAPRRAMLNDELPNAATLRTGDDSRAEITFANDCVARLWADSVLEAKRGPRDLQLVSGVVLVEVPRGARGKIEGPGVAAAISGATIMFECHPTIFKFLVLQGTGRLYRPAHWGDSLLVHPGQMVIGNPKAPLSDPVDFDIGRFVKTSRLLTDFSPLSSEHFMLAESEKQQREKSNKVLIDTNLVIFGGGTHVSIVNPNGSAAAVPQPSASPAAEAVKTP